MGGKLAALSPLLRMGEAMGGHTRAPFGVASGPFLQGRLLEPLPILFPSGELRRLPTS